MTDRPLRVLLTAGPTREFIDAVRYISNRSSGRMGVSIAHAFADHGAQVTLVAGPCEVPLPDRPEVEVVPVVTAVGMFEAVAARFADCDVFVAAAAVADYRPADRVAGKLKKGSTTMTLDLVANPDILYEMGDRRRPGQTLIGFALEVQDPEFNAQQKLVRKRCDVIVLNAPDNMGDTTGTLRLIDASGEFAQIRDADKTATGRALVERILERVNRP